MRWINTREEMKELQKELGVRHDWHEPDESGVEIIFVGRKFDNAMPTFAVSTYENGSPKEVVEPTHPNYLDHICENSIVFLKHSKPIAAINVAIWCWITCQGVEVTS